MSELAKELEKAARFLTKVRFYGGYDDSERKRIVRMAFEDDATALREIVAEVFGLEEGIKHIIRALNNLSVIKTKASLLLATILLDTAKSATDNSALCLKYAQVLSAVDDMPYAEIRALMADAKDCLETQRKADKDFLPYFILLEAHLACFLRNGDPTAGALIDDYASWRLSFANNRAHRVLTDPLEDPKTHWSRLLAIHYISVVLPQTRLKKISSFLDHAMQTFPPESILAVEATMIAIEYDASFIAEQNLAKKRIYQMNRDGKKIERYAVSELEAIAREVMSHMQYMPTNFLELLTQFPDLTHEEQLAVGAVFDKDTRNAWITAFTRAKKFKVFAKIFFDVMSTDNALLYEMCESLIAELYMNHSGECMWEDRWLTAKESGDHEAMQHTLREIRAFLDDI